MSKPKSKKKTIFPKLPASKRAIRVGYLAANNAYDILAKRKKHHFGLVSYKTAYLVLEECVAEIWQENKSFDPLQAAEHGRSLLARVMSCKDKNSQFLALNHALYSSI